VSSPHRIEDIDEDILHEIVQVPATKFSLILKKFAVDRETVIRALTEEEENNGVANEFQVAYNLIYDNQKMYTGITEKVLLILNRKDSFKRGFSCSICHLASH